jgi:hypothetical protein
MNTCTCNNKACEFRMARGMVPFCQIPAPAQTVRAGFDTYQEAAQHANGRKIRSVGGILKGFPVRFVIA